MATNPSDIAEAYMRVAKANHYLVTVDKSRLTLEELGQAEQLLIRGENAVSADKTVKLALDLCEHDIREKVQGG